MTPLRILNSFDKDLAPLMSESNAVAQVMISSTMPISDITRHLVDHRCKDVTQYLDLSSCDETPISWGGFGDIYRGRLSDGTQVAIKCARYSIGSHAESRKVLKRSAHELYVWSKYQHLNLLELFGFAQFRGRIAMVSPWMENGNLSQYVSRNPGVDRCRLCVQVCEGLTYLHNMDTVHGDLKAANVLVSKEGVAKITDFGNTRLQEYTLCFAPTSKGLDFTLRWTAPELVSEQPCLPSCESDVYALGMTILEVITGQVPYAGLSDYAVMVAVACRKQAPPRPDIFIPYESSVGDVLWRMLESCWDPDPKSRAKASSIRDMMAKVTHEGLTRRDTYIFVN
ncbi:hypothetical protein FRC08_005212 [Ceratobasidium sp. 394]|nr:hypothetical protein FRC08_005212 [Ceratobasidium sp. 394]